MRSILAFVLISLSLSSLAEAVRADTLVLRDGTQLSGTLVSATTQTITFKDTKGVVHRYNRTKIQTLEFAATDAKSTAAAVPGRWR